MPTSRRMASYCFNRFVGTGQLAWPTTAFSLNSVLFLFLLSCGFGQAFAKEPDLWRVDSQLQTVAEQSDYRATASSAFVVDFVKTVDLTKPRNVL